MHTDIGHKKKVKLCNTNTASSSGSLGTSLRHSKSQCRLQSVAISVPVVII